MPSLSPTPSAMFRPLLRRVAAPLAAATLSLVPAARAEAQLTPCLPGSLSDYLSTSAPCELGGFRIGRFSLFQDIIPGSTLPVELPDPDAVTLTPFENLPDALGHVTFGFTVDGFFIRVQATNNTDPDAFGGGVSFFGFALRRIDPNTRLLGAGFDGRMRNQSTTPDDVSLFSGTGGDVGRRTGYPFPDPPYCLARHPDLLGVGTRTPSRDGDCPRPWRRARAIYGVTAALTRNDPTSTDPISGTARASIQEVRFVAQTVPEPATVALLGGGLLGLAGIATRRRTRG